MGNNKIEFRKKRDFGDVINATFTFLKAHLGHFFRMQLFISLPFALIAVIFISIFPARDLFVVSDFSKNTGQNIFHIIVYAIAGLTVPIFLVSGIYQYVDLYIKKGTNFLVTDLWKAILGKFWSMTKMYFLFSITFTLLLIVIGLFVALIISNSGINFVLIGLWYLFSGAVSLYFLVPLSFIFIIRSFEPEKTFWQIIKRSVYLVKGNWWSCFGTIIIMIFIQYILILIIQIPFTIFGMAITQANFMGVLSMSGIVRTITIIVTLFLPILATIFQYFSLVEMKDAIGLNEQVEKFGTVANNDENEDEKEDY